MPQSPTVPPTTGELINVGSLLAAGAAHAEPKNLSGSKPYAIIPVDYKLHELTPAIDPPLPDHIKQIVTLDETEAFCDYINLFKGTDTRVFGTVREGQGADFLAVLDYHHTRADADATQANRSAHKAVYAAPFSSEWKKWRTIGSKYVNQTEFANFIDENAPDIVSPNSASMLELAMNFEMKSDVKFSSKITPASGGRQLTYIDDPEAGIIGGGMKVPDIVQIRIPVFKGGKLVDINAKFGYQAPSGKLGIIIQIRRVDAIIDAAVKDIIQDIITATGLKPLIGCPK